jgi:hypothetical protein
LIGAQKAGTTTLYHILRRHPEIFMSPVKEPNYFARADAAQDRPPTARTPNYEIDWPSYLRLFAPARPGQECGEASPAYLYSAAAPGEILERLPEVKLVAILRDPVERAYSNYLHCVRKGVEPLPSFEEALAAEPARIASGWGPNWHYRAKGLYAEQLARYLTFFPPAHVKVLIYERFREAPAPSVREMFAFLGVDPEFSADLSTRHNVTTVARLPQLQPALSALNPHVPKLKPFVPRAVRSLLRWALTMRPALDPATAVMLRRSYEGDILRLTREFGLEVDHWLTAGPAG